ncbi:MAG TPA: dCMP deaminase family protein [Chitinophagaceae bacterium]|nr:dCMP deaminase family protein [Chitinophagaceae bacterium]
MAALQKRKDYISWDEYFMGVALLSARRSKDPSTQVGACIVNDKNKIVGAGYNGLPIGCDDDEFPWEKQGDFLQTKYPYVCHAELNAILNNIGMDLSGCKIYTALFPCNECAKAIIQSGITEVIYLSDKYADTEIFKASKILLEKAGISSRKVKTKLSNISLSFDAENV